MALPTPPDADRLVRRVVLIDLDWQEADLVPELVRRPGIHVRLVAGESEQNPGWRVAELCGVPRTMEIADLTREIFDLALVGEHSDRRHQLERLLTALGTPMASPRSFMESAPAVNGHGRSAEEPADAEKTAFFGTPDADALDAALRQAIPDLSASRPEDGGTAASTAGELPGPDDPAGLGLVLAHWAEGTGVSSAVVHAGVGALVMPVCRFGEADPLLDALVHLSLALETPHVVSRLDGPDRGKAWGAWPFRTRGGRGVVAAARLEPVEGRARWEEAVQSLRVSWEKHERARGRDETAPPRRVPGLDPQGFASCLAAAVEGHRRDGAPFAVHRLRFDETAECLEGFCASLTERLRETDTVVRPTPRDLVLLHHGVPGTFTPLRRRLVALWEETWLQSGRSTPAPPIVEERIALVGREDIDFFVTTVRSWLGIE